MSRTYYEPPAPFRSRQKPARPTVELNPHTVHLIGNGPLYELVIDCGSEQPAYIVKMPTDLAAILRNKLNTKHIGERP